MTWSTRTSSFLSAAAAGALCAACAQGSLETQTASNSASGGVVPAAYVVAGEDSELDCKRLAGKVQIRILELRSRLSAEETSALSRTLQSAGTAAFGGTKRGLDPKSERARDLAQVEAYNRELAARKCKSFDLEKALAGNETVPTPTIPPPATR